MQSGYVESLQIQRKKGQPFECVTFVELEAGKGIVGDCHALGGEKQIALISSKSKQWIRKQEKEGLCFRKFQENIVTQGIDYTRLNEGDILIIDHAAIEIGTYTKRCFPECTLRQTDRPCVLTSGTCFGKVKKSGKIQTGDQIRQTDSKT
ncbi:MOSC domain-containing protein [Lacrimispora sp. AGF001]|uniref:MOSC domain-containing protein n=1 Tax=Lacrimispora sp. AGF001 TaxID=3401631 RepID=UPI003B43B07F